MKRSKSTKVTKRMRAVLAEICTFKAAHDGQAPTRRELMRLCGLHSPSTVSYYLARLEASGLIRTQNEGEARGIEVVGGRWEPPDELLDQLELAAQEKRDAEQMVRAHKIADLSMADLVQGAARAFNESVSRASAEVLKATMPRYPQIAAIGKLVRDDGR